MKKKKNKKKNRAEKPIENRSELIYLYDIRDANPNGDPLNENRPRIDEETGINLVTDVRLKRTIRDYLYDYRDKEILIRTIKTPEGNIQDAKTRAEDFCEEEDLSITDKVETIKENLLNECIDVRLFGATLPVSGAKKEGSIALTGPVQFNMGRSLNKVEVQEIKGTGAFASKKKKRQKTFRWDYIVPYSLICFHGIVNENAGKRLGLSKTDLQLLLEGVWKGTKNLITRTKVGQTPRLLLQIVYGEENYHIGDLDRRIEHYSEKGDREIREISDLSLDIRPLMEKLSENTEKIEKIRYKVDSSLTFIVPSDKEEEKKVVKGEEVKPVLERACKEVEEIKF